MICSFVFLLIGLHPSKTKLELQKHLTTLNNQEQASVFEEVKVSCKLFVSNKILKQLIFFFANISVKHQSYFHFLVNYSLCLFNRLLVTLCFNFNVIVFLELVKTCLLMQMAYFTHSSSPNATCFP